MMKNNKEKITVYPWYYGTIFLAIVNILSFSWKFVDRNYYIGLHMPWYAPPVWLFGVAWTFNNVLAIIGNIWTLNLPPSRERTILIWLQAISWINYILYTGLSFGTRIPALFFFPTLSMWFLTILSIFYAIKLDSKDRPFWTTVKMGRSIAFSLSSLLVWLSVACILSYYVWTNN